MDKRPRAIISGKAAGQEKRPVRKSGWSGKAAGAVASTPVFNPKFPAGAGGPHYGRSLTSVIGGIYDVILDPDFLDLLFFTHFHHEGARSILWPIQPRLRKPRRKSGTTEE